MEASRPYVGTSDDLSHKKDSVRRLAGLGASEEQALCRRWFEYHDLTAATRLVAGHLNIIGSIATEYDSCRITPHDLVGEGFIGLMRALCRYEPACGMAFTAYATRCIRAAIESSILRSEASVKVATTARRGRRTRNRAGSGNGHASINPRPICVISARRDAAALVTSQYHIG